MWESAISSNPSLAGEQAWVPGTGRSCALHQVIQSFCVPGPYHSCTLPAPPDTLDPGLPGPVPKTRKGFISKW